METRFYLGQRKHYEDRDYDDITIIEAVSPASAYAILRKTIEDDGHDIEDFDTFVWLIPVLPPGTERNAHFKYNIYLDTDKPVNSRSDCCERVYETSQLAEPDPVS